MYATIDSKIRIFSCSLSSRLIVIAKYQEDEASRTPTAQEVVLEHEKGDSSSRMFECGEPLATDLEYSRRPSLRRTQSLKDVNQISTCQSTPRMIQVVSAVQIKQTDIRARRTTGSQTETSSECAKSISVESSKAE